MGARVLRASAREDREDREVVEEWERQVIGGFAKNHHLKKRSDVMWAQHRKDHRIFAPRYCSECRAANWRRPLRAHHEDYAKPFDVVWLCGTCHYRRHEELKRVPQSGYRHEPEQRASRNHRQSRRDRELTRRLRVVLETRRAREVAEACQVNERTVRNWRDGNLPNSPAIRANLVTYLDRMNGGSK